MIPQIQTIETQKKSDTFTENDTGNERKAKKRSLNGSTYKGTKSNIEKLDFSQNLSLESDTIT